MIELGNIHQKKLDEMMEKLENETNIHRKRQLECKIYDYKKKHFPKTIVRGKGKTYRHY